MVNKLSYKLKKVPNEMHSGLCKHKCPVTNKFAHVVTKFARDEM